MVEVAVLSLQLLQDQFIITADDPPLPVLCYALPLEGVLKPVILYIER